MKHRVIMLGMAAILLASAATAQEDLRKEPGYVDLDAMESWFGEEPFLFVSVKGVLLDLVAEASSIEDPDLADLLRKLKAVQVRGYKAGRVDVKAMRSRASEFSRELEKQGWEPATKPGRHIMGSNMFWYFTPPVGGRTEYFADMDRLTEDWEPPVWQENPGYAMWMME